ncbi:MAG TPA: phosphoribosyltransferase family protein [Mucilaginibacter sp.]|jgi:ComF family protein
MKLQAGYLADFVSLLFPELCQACGESLVAGEDLLCLDCRYNLPYTDFHLKPDNMVAQQFWGKINLEAAYALCYFTKGGKMQHLMHQFKYKGIQKIGDLLGNIAGDQLDKNPIFNTVDIIIPVPLHKSRLRKRGYNQSVCFANGLAERLNVPVDEDNLVRIRATDTQTHRSRFSRFENMQQVFALTNPATLINKHVLLVDDVVTTGSTLEACGTELLKVEGLKLSIATIACAE